MIARVSLSGKIVLLAAVNLILLVGIFAAFARYQYHVELGTFLFAPARDRVVSVASEVGLLLEQTPVAARTGLMGRFASTYQADFYLFENGGEQLAGRPVELPAEVRRKLTERTADSRPGGRGRGRRGDLKGAPPPRQDGREFDKGPPPDQAPELADLDYVAPRGRDDGDRDGKLDGKRGRPEEVRKGPPDPVRDHVMFEIPANSLFWVGVRIPIGEPGGFQPIRGTLVLAAPSFYGTPLFFDFKPWLSALGAVVAVFALCWLPFVRSLTKTVSGITRATDLISRGNFDRHLPEGRGDELGQLSGAINRMADRLSGFVTGQKRFLGDIAHELCAPIARIEFGVGILEHRASEADRDAVADVRDEIRQMSALVGELLLFSKAGMEPETKVLQSVDVESAIREAVSREQVAGVSISMSIAGQGLVAMADYEFLVRAISNLVRNAIRYAGTAGPLTVSAERDGSDIVLKVADEGPGLPSEELERIFRPFYRLDSSRNRSSGGAGLGLAIVKSCVEACRGRVQCRNRLPSGLEVEIRLIAS